MSMIEYIGIAVLVFYGSFCVPGIIAYVYYARKGNRIQRRVDEYEALKQAETELELLPWFSDNVDIHEFVNR